MKKLLTTIFILFICAVAFLIIARNFIVKAAITKVVETLAGVKVEIGRIDIGLTGSRVEVNSLKLHNPKGFSEKLMADIPLVYVDYDLLAFLQNKVHFKKIKIEIKEITAVVNNQGKLNLNSLAMLMPKPGGGTPPEVKIDELFLKISKVGYKGHFPATGERAMDFNPNIEETFRDVTNPSALARDILKKILSRIGIAGLVQFDIAGEAAKTKESAQQAVSAGVEAAKTSAQESIDKAKEGLKSIFQQ